MKTFMVVFVIFMLFTTAPTRCLADNIDLEVTVDKTALPLSSNVTLSITFHGIRSIPAPNLPDIEGFDWKYIGPATRMSIVNGKTASSITHNYILIPLKTGSFKVPPIKVSYKGRTYTSKPIGLKVSKGQVPHRQPPVSNPDMVGNEGLRDRVFLVMSVGKKRAYVNEPVPITIKLFVNRLAIRDIQYPEFDHKGFLTEKFGEPKKQEDVINGVYYDVIEFDTTLSGIGPGEFTLGPARLKCNLVIKKSSARRGFPSLFDDDFFDSDIFDDFFGRYENRPIEVKSMNIPISILPLPEQGRPKDFKGAVGDYTFSVDIEPKSVRVGDPITLKMTISGKGNLKSVESPAASLGDGYKVYEPEVELKGAQKIFKQAIVPRSADITNVPAITFSFFDTAKGQYRSITKGPIPVDVRPLPKGEGLQVYQPPPAGPTRQQAQEKALGRDIIYIKEAPGRLRRQGSYLYSNRLFLLVFVIPLIAVAYFSIAEARRQRLASDVRYARSLRAPRKARMNLKLTARHLNAGERDKFFDSVFKTMQEYLGDKFHLPSVSITVDVLRQIESKNADKAVLDNLKSCFDICDRARYAPSSITDEDMKRTFKLLEESIYALERLKV